MTDTMNEDTQNTPTSSAAADETFAWSAEPEATATSNGDKAREWLTQLQAMIENLATQAAPVIREIGVKAAELAATAGEKAGPVAQRAAELTGQAGQKIAERSRVFAADLRADQAEADAAVEAKDTTPAGVA
jgi:hypothetical protein